MTVSRRLLVSCLVVLLPALLVPAVAAEQIAPQKILFFSKSSEFEHSVIKRRNGQPSWAERALAKAGPARGFAFTFSKDGSLFTPEYLAQFDAFLFYTSGDLLAAGKDGNPPMTVAGKAALLDAIRLGKGFVGVHSAADTFHTGETTATNTQQPRTWRYRDLGDKADPYLRMLGGELIVHGTEQVARIRVVDPVFPGLTGLGDHFDLVEEWYSLTGFAPDLHAVLVLDTGVMRDPFPTTADWPPAGWHTPYQRPPYPVAWAHAYGTGRVYYTVLAHREDTWLSPLFQDMLFGALRWAVHEVGADVTPNLARVAPHAAELPPVSGPVSGLPKAEKAALEKMIFP
jgi:type 1 glutamine amidotransferase